MDSTLLRRARSLSHTSITTDIHGPVLYWMSRDQRIDYNWALIFALELAQKNETHVDIVFALSPSFPGANIRHYDFMLKGLRDVEKRAHELGIKFSIITGDVEKSVTHYIIEGNYSTVITDFSPLKISQSWKKSVVEGIKKAGRDTIQCIEVDAHNIVPAWIASQHAEFAARTFRPKLLAHMPEFYTDFPDIHLRVQKSKDYARSNIDWDSLYSSIQVDMTVEPVTWIQPGQESAHKACDDFVQHGFKLYEKNRNEPSVQGQSNLSPYLHFGHICSQYIALKLCKKITAQELSRGTFFDELIVRKELSDNFCLYNENYDSLLGAPAWALETLKAHAHDVREYTYSYDDFKMAHTHDELWNAAQQEMVKRGKMSGYMRMYWAKKILEWTKTPEEAHAIALRLNDTYELDGRDPNGYVGVLWSIAGVHDRPWFPRKIFGLIRYMSEKGVRSKINAEAYIEQNLNGQTEKIF